MVRVEAENGDIWEMDEAWLAMIFERSDLSIPVQNKEAFDQLVSYARERQSRVSQAAAGAATSEEAFDREFIQRYKDASLQEVAHVASVIYEHWLRKMIEAGTPEDQARTDLDLVM